MYTRTARFFGKVNAQMGMNGFKLHLVTLSPSEYLPPICVLIQNRLYRLVMTY